MISLTPIWLPRWVKERTYKQICAAVVALVTVLQVLTPTLLAQTSSPSVYEYRKIKAYTLEDFEITGTDRISKDLLAEELSLKAGTVLDDAFIMETRSKILSLGLFKSAILMMRRGSEPGRARLIIELEDDEHILTDWAIGGELSVLATETTAAAVASSNQTPLDYSLTLVSRNMFNQLHRASLMAAVDADGILREAEVAYGLPRFTHEDVTFDANVHVTDTQRRYLNILGYSMRAQGLWLLPSTSFGQIQYGAALYGNRVANRDGFAMPGFPSSIAGPKVKIFKETRLIGFVPGSGYQWHASILVPPMRGHFTTVELGGAATLSIADLVYCTVDIQGLSTGKFAQSLRAETRFDILLPRSLLSGDQASLFARLRGGIDRGNILDGYEEGSRLDYYGSAAFFGVRYHSAGFIAELGLKITRSLNEITLHEAVINRRNERRNHLPAEVISARGVH